MAKPAPRKATKRARKIARPMAEKPAIAAVTPSGPTPKAKAKKPEAQAFSPTSFNPQRFSENMAKASEIWAQVIGSLKLPDISEHASLHMNPSQMQEAWAKFANSVMHDPKRWVDMQMQMWQDYTAFWQHTAARMTGETDTPYIQPDSKDRRFKDEAWGGNIFYDVMKESYLMANKWMHESLHIADVKDDHAKKKISFFAQQIIDALSPSNYLLTNPQAMKELLESNGENLVHGLQYLLEDVERGDGNLRIRMTDESAFKVGKNLAATPGSVVYENELMQLIQYEPTTDTVHQTPLLIMPAWINKYYIFDLQEKNSFVKWAVDQGHTVFMVSWVNPDESLSHKSFDDYLKEGPLAALKAIKKATGETGVNVIGYCLGGTLLSILMAYLEAKGESERVKSATLLTTLTDYSDVGDLSVFIDDETIASIEDRMSARGYMPAEDMANTFCMLRSNDLIWSFYINNYLLGKTPFPFDILYWNSDSTRLPKEMNRFYLRNFYQKNLLIKPGGVSIDGVAINLRKVKTPTYMLSTKEDHIAPWKSTYVTSHLFSGPVTFTLAESGHVAGVISPVGKKKYGYYASNALPDTADQWMEAAEYTQASWWTHWNQWAAEYVGEDVPARKVGKGLKKIEPAPGRYVAA